MTAVKFWDEELRSYPLGGGEARLWVVRRDGDDRDASLRMIFRRRWGCGLAGDSETGPPPLTRLLQVMADELAAEFLQPDPRETPGDGAGNKDNPKGRMLRVAPLRCGGRVLGAFALSHPAEAPWAEAVGLWAERFAARTEVLLPHLPAPEGSALAGADSGPTLFPLVAAASAGRRRRERTSQETASAAAVGLPLPRPLGLPGAPGLIGVSREMAACCAIIRKVAASEVNVMLHGESGTGKEVLARALHQNGPRRDKPFIGINCASLPETLFESELFGHKAGAFTGAAREKTGLLEAADGGTFFLDEIGDMPQPLQIKLLRVMQERRLRRIGELQTRPVDVRFVAASHKNLENEIDAGRFRLDLYYRLKVVQVDIPPLRRRPEDVIPLLSWFIRRRGNQQEGCRIAEEAAAALQRYRWPGNVRELENEAKRWLALWGGEELIRLEQLSPDVQRAAGRSVDLADLATLRPLDEATELLERYLIRKSLSVCGGMKSAAARRLGLSRQGLYKKIRRYGMNDLLPRAE